MGEKWPIQFCLQHGTSTVSVGIFYMPQIYDMGPTALLPLRRKACWGFFRLKNPTASAGFEPANLGTRGQHALAHWTHSQLNSIAAICLLTNCTCDKETGRGLQRVLYDSRFDYSACVHHLMHINGHTLLLFVIITLWTDTCNKLKNCNNK